MQNLLWKVIMELMLVFTAVCFSLSLLQSPCVSLEIQVLVQPTFQKASVNEVQLSVLPRKIRFTPEVTVKGHGDPETVSHSKQKEVFPGEEYKEEEKVMHRSKGTWEEWQEGEGRDHRSEYFTMDYSHVKRRRHIHNKSLPQAGGGGCSLKHTTPHRPTLPATALEVYNDSSIDFRDNAL